MRVKRRKWIQLAVTGVLLLVGVAVFAAIATTPSGRLEAQQRCFPAPVRVEPATAHPGSALTVNSDAADCDLGYARGHTYSVVVRHRDTVTDPVRTEVRTDGVFRTTIDLPADFPAGDAVVIVTGSPYDDCDDTGSCVGYSALLTVE